MRSIKKYKLLFVIASILFTSSVIVLPAAASASPLAPAPVVFASDPACKDVTPSNSDDELKNAKKNNNGGENTGMNCIVERYVNPFINLLAAAAGIAVVISIVMGAIQYSSAGGDPGKVSAARDRIRNAIIALLAFLFLYAFLNWLLPGGIGN